MPPSSVCCLGFTHMHINSGPISSRAALCVSFTLADTGAGFFHAARETNGAPSSVSLSLFLAAGGARMQLMLLRNKKQMWPELKTSLCHPHPQYKTPRKRGLLKKHWPACWRNSFSKYNPKRGTREMY